MSEVVLTPKNTLFAGLTVETVRDTPSYINLLIYGESGIGKTRLAGSADDVPEMRKVLFIDVEGGTFSLKGANPNVEVIRVRTWKDMTEIYSELHAGQHEYQTVVIDSLTEIQKFHMYEVMKDVYDKDSDRDPDIPSMREWGKNIEVMRRFVRLFRDLPFNTIFTALAKSDKDPKRGITTKKPLMAGKLASEVPAFLDVVLYMYTKEQEDGVHRYLLTGTTEEYVAKDRSGQLPLVIADPTMKDLYTLLNSQGEQS